MNKNGMLNLGIYFFQIYVIIFNHVYVCVLVPAKVRSIGFPGEDGYVMIYVCAGNRSTVP